MKSGIRRLLCSVLILSSIFCFTQYNVGASAHHENSPWEDFEYILSRNYTDPAKNLYDDGTACYEYTTLMDGTLAITSIAIKDRNDDVLLYIPSMIDGKEVTQIADRAGYNLDAFGDINITISDTIKSIGSYAFYESRATEIFVPYSVKFFGQDWCRSSMMEFVYVDESNEIYSSDNGVLLSKDRRRLIYFPPQKFPYDGSIGDYRYDVYTVPTTITSIAPKAFEDSSGLTEAILPAGLNEIGEYAFSGCDNMESVYLPFGLTEICEGTFSYCSKLSKVAIPSSVKSIAPNAFYKDSDDEDAVPLTIICTKNSAAEEFCKDNGIEFTIDPKVDSAVSPTTEVVRGNLKRISGDDRVLTAIEISKSGWNSADTVFIANGYSYPDALAGAPLANYYDAPMLLTSGKRIEASILSEIERLGANDIIILGGTAAISQAVEDELAQSYTVTRFAGANRYETAEKIAKSLLDLTEPPYQIAIVSAENYPDALSISPFAAGRCDPIVFSNKTGKLSANLTKLLKDKDIHNAVIVGGANAVGNDCKKNLEQCGFEYISRIGGKDRYETSLRIAEHYYDCYDIPIVFATGENYPDALAGGVFAARLSAPIILLNPKNGKSPAISKYVEGVNPRNIYALGGSDVLPNKAVDGYIASGRPVDDDFSIPAGDTKLSGRVIEKDSGAGLDEIDVSIYEKINGELRYLTSATTDSSGRFTANNVSISKGCTSLSCEVVKAGYSQSNMSASISANSKSIDLGTLSVENQFGYVEGIVTECGTPVADADVDFYRVVGGVNIYVPGTVTDSSGHYRMALPDGRYYLNTYYSYLDYDYDYYSPRFDVVAKQVIIIDSNNGYTGALSCDVRCGGKYVDGAEVSLFYDNELLDTKTTHIGESTLFSDLLVHDGQYTDYYTIHVSYGSYSVWKKVGVSLRDNHEIVVDVDKDDKLTEVRLQFDYDETAKLCSSHGDLILDVYQGEFDVDSDSSDYCFLGFHGCTPDSEAVTYIEYSDETYYITASGTIYADKVSGEGYCEFEDSDPVKLDITAGSNQFIVHIGVNSSNKIVLSVEKTA